MIKVIMQAEPETFNSKVRLCGNTWMEKNPDKTPKSFWRNCLDDMFTAYAGICAYLSFRIERSYASVDHFLPKNTHKELAYEWSNYRLSSKDVNTDKDNSLQVLDPFEVENDYFGLNVLTGEVCAASTLNDDMRQKIENTIVILKLNKSDYCSHRLALIEEYEYDLEGLFFESPFLSTYLQRKN